MKLKGRSEAALRGQVGGRCQALELREPQAALRQRLVGHLQVQRREGPLCQPGDMGLLRSVQHRRLLLRVKVAREEVVRCCGRTDPPEVARD
eukprot:10068439-Prorocentrum_lima.AAC.1